MKDLDLFNAILLFMFSALVVEYLTEIIKSLIKSDLKRGQIISLIFGIVIAFGYNLDIPAQFGVTSAYSYVGLFITGIGISGGAGGVYNLLTRGKNIVNDTLKLLGEENPGDE